MKFSILVIGDFISEMHEKSLSKAFQDLGHQVHNFEVLKFFEGSNKISKKLQLELQIGFGVSKMNNQLMRMRFRDFDFVFFYRPRLIYPKNIKKICKSTTAFFYNNDDPFGESYHKIYWKNYFKGLKYVDHIFYYRNKNKIDYEKMGFSNISLLRSYYISKFNYNIDCEKMNDVVFIGHYENDGRDDLFKYLHNNGVKLKIYGPEWNRSKWFNYFKKKGMIFDSLSLPSYNLVLNQSKISIVLFSKLNNDGYTRRCFEIPLTKSLMICQESDEIKNIFHEDEEIILFKNQFDLANKIKKYLKDTSLREKIVKNCYDRVLKDKHEVRDRASEVILTYKKLNDFSN